MKVVTFGEILLRLSSHGYQRLFQNNSFEVSFCGAEANVAVSLSNFGLESYFISKIPNNDIGQAVLNTLRYYGVNTKYLIKDGERLGILYLEKGASQRPSKVIYDRKNSAISQAILQDFDWDMIFDGAEWFHFTGITPALSENLKVICLEASKKAKEKGLVVSCDINYREKLWSKEEAEKAMSKIMPYVDVCIANEEDAEKVFGIKSEGTNVLNGELNYEGYKYVARKIHERFDCKYVAITLRTSISANYNKWAGIFYVSEFDKFFRSKEYGINIVDRLGAGDSFCAGIIYGLLNNMTYQECVDFAVASSCLKHTIEGDFNIITVEEVLNLMNGDASGRVKR